MRVSLVFLAALLLAAPSADSTKGSAPAAMEAPLEEQLGQTFVVGIPGQTLDPETESLLRQIKPGGVVLYRRNFASPAQLEELIASLQALARETTRQPYLIMIDEEPGGATRLGLFSNVFAFGEPDWIQIERDISVLEKLGINVELAPVADYPFNRNSFIRSRVPAHSVEALTAFNRRFIELLARHGISATLKHFPGMGAFRTDPHHELPAGRVPTGGLDESLRIFQDGITAGAGLVMTGHAVYTNVDPGRPATLSSRIVTGILRRQMKFRGLIITDDLSEMPFLEGTKMNLDQATCEALKAGHNMVLFSHKLHATKAVLDQVLAAAQGDARLRSLITQDYARIVAFKKDHRGSKQASAAVFGNGF